jgi:hypothetical protein
MAGRGALVLRSRSVVGWLIVAASMWGCGTSTTLTPPATTSTPAAAVSPTVCPSLQPTPEGDTADHTIAGIFVEGTLHFSMGDEDYAARATVFVARIAGIEPAGHFRGESWLSTPVLVDTEEAIRGPMPAGRTRILIGGDLRDCHYLEQPEADRLDVGLDYVFFLVPISAAGTGPIETQWAEAVWPLDSKGTVTTVGGPMPLAELKARLHRIPVPSGFAYPTD